MAQQKGVITFEVLADGTVKTETTDMAGPDHSTVDKLLKEFDALLGGAVTTEKSKAKHEHAHHTHDHTHKHEH